MSIFLKRSFYTLLFLFALLNSAWAQQSIVPSYHPVYDWLYSQRVSGSLPQYSFESLPHRRIQILDYLLALQKKRHFLTEHDQALLDDFLNEFDHTRKQKQAKELVLFGEDGRVIDRFTKALKDRSELNTYIYADSNSNITLDLGYGGGLWYGKEDTSIYPPKKNLQQSQSFTGYTSMNMRVYGTVYSHLGFHFEYLSKGRYTDNALRKYHPLLAKNWKYLELGGDLSYHTEGYSTLAYKNLDFTIGKGLQKVGVGIDDNLVFSREGIAFNWMRLKYQSSWFTALMMHGALTYKSRGITTGTGSDLATFNISPSRWVAYQRFELRPLPWIQFAWYELVNYSQRSLDISYFNLPNRLFLSEWDNQDRDNAWVGIDGIIRPFKGLELYGELLIDDFGGNKFDIFNFSDKAAFRNNKFARRLGFTYNAPAFAQLNVDYQRIEPNIFSHKNLYNAHTEKNLLLGTQVGPNSDRAAFELKRWISKRGFIRARYAYFRKGLNEYENGVLSRNVGSDPNLNYNIDYDDTFIFLDGDLQRYSNYLLEYVVEPYRSVQVHVRLQKQTVHEGTRTPNYWYGEIGATLGMNY